MREPRPTIEPFTCVTCEIEIVAPPSFHVGLPFCCAGCVAGGPCMCSYDEVPGDPQIRHCLDVQGALGRGQAVEGGAELAASRA